MGAMPSHLLQLAEFAAWCGAPPRPVPLLLFLTGLVGGVAHCGPRCGPFVLTQAAALSVDGPVLRRLAGALLWPYHLGRIATYSALGAGAAAIGTAAASLVPVRVALTALLLGAAVLFAGPGVARLAPAFAGRQPGLGLRWAERAAAALVTLSRPFFADPSRAGRFALGATLGLLPCGLLYAALAAAATTGSPGAGAAAMAAFGLGTVPSLAVIAVGGATAGARWRAAARWALGPVFLCNAAVLATLALAAARVDLGQ